ncbi:GNAT family N-acetyltransferase [Kribbella albertanoniae]|uniref:N-acetyltransferase n=1 Tax=Kribbella albertanoniae TaxID=1266829 RepID=A0A4R4QHF9_9ACTN|nr:GNAT family N-acetyltransferase [Kribbella albertanoniae]TDC35054.1 N-acetyltransferase [Kribbella albertanoniae]
MIATAFSTSRLTLLPLAPLYAEEMAGVLADPALYAFTGGEPPTVDALRARYERQLAGSGRADEHWLNWVIQAGDELIGFVQSTVTGSTAEVAWVIGSAWQGHGYAKEAALGLVDWLKAQELRIVCHIHPDHSASAAVAAAVGLSRTDQLDDGEYLYT